MLKILFILALVSVCFAIQLPHATTSEFRQFIQKFNKSYSSDELPKRYEAFVKNLKTIERLNTEARAQGRDTKFGITKFSDLTPQEFKQKYMGYKPIQKGRALIQESHLSALPVSFDWTKQGAVTPVKDQGQCGSCWAFSATEGVESAWYLAKKELLQLSPQEIVSCDNNDDGCDGGDLPTAFGFVQQYGMETGAEYPYTSGNGDTGTCKYDKTKVKVHISGFKYATQSGNETQMQAALVEHGPLSVCVDAETWQNYQGGVITHGCGDNLDHCVQITGFNQNAQNVKYWIVRNSWGTDWGLSGYLWVERNKDECGISDEATYVTI